jgi:hypothetical protein
VRGRWGEDWTRRLRTLQAAPFPVRAITAALLTKGQQKTSTAWPGEVSHCSRRHCSTTGDATRHDLRSHDPPTYDTLRNLQGCFDRRVALWNKSYPPWVRVSPNCNTRAQLFCICTQACSVVLVPPYSALKLLSAASVPYWLGPAEHLPIVHSPLRQTH